MSENTKKKDAFYFSHDSNARLDEKMLQMRSAYGAEGYGMYWMLIEKMRDTTNYKLSIKGKYSNQAMASDLQVEPVKLKSFIEECINEFKLFQTDGKLIWSESLLRRMSLMEEKSSKARQSAMARWNKNEESSSIDANAMRTHNDGIATKEN